MNGTPEVQKCEGVQNANPITSTGREIPLTGGRMAIVDDGDYDWINQWKWKVSDDSRKILYAVRYVIWHDDEGEKHRRKVRMHRVIMKTPPEFEVDHIDGNGLNNQKNNMRNCSHIQNMQNLRHFQNGKPHKGYYWNKRDKCYQGCITHNKKRIPLGCFHSAKEAAIAYNKAAERLFGEFAFLNTL